MSVILFLLVVANGAPIVAHNIFREKFAYPLDGGKQFYGQDLFGASKTWRGIVVAIIATGIAAELLGIGFLMGTLFGLFAMLGDLLSSFIKRRLGMKPSSMAFGLDQIPESLFPTLIVAPLFHFTVMDIVVVVALFVMIELLLSYILFRLKLRRQPY